MIERERAMYVCTYMFDFKQNYIVALYLEKLECYLTRELIYDRVLSLAHLLFCLSQFETSPTTMLTRSQLGYSFISFYQFYSYTLYPPFHHWSWSYWHSTVCHPLGIIQYSYQLIQEE